MTRVVPKTKRKYYLQYEIAKYEKHLPVKNLIIRSASKRIDVGAFDFGYLPAAIIKKIKELQTVYGYTIQQNIILTTQVMTEIDPLKSTRTKYLNHLVEVRRIAEFNNAYGDLKEFCDANGLAKPNKGRFLSDVIGKGMEGFDASEYMKSKV